MATGSGATAGATAEHGAHALALEHVGRRFGGLSAVSDVSLHLAPGERRAIIGPNGAGKTTLFNLITGDLPPTSGTIHFFGHDITALPAHERVRRGMARTYQTPSPFPSLSVLDNLFIAVRGVRPRRLSLRRPNRDDPAMRRAREIAAQVGLTDLIGVRSGALGHGQQRKLEIAMTLATDPKLLLLDEPAAGLSPGERMHLADLLQGLDPAITIVLVEHDMDVAFRVAGKVTAIDGGRVIAEGTPDEISVNEQVQQVYLGMRRA